MNRFTRRQITFSTLPLSALLALWAARPLLAAPAGQAATSPTAPAANKAAASPMTGATTPDYKTPMSKAQFERHVLNRLAFGPRLGDIEKLRAMGFRAWVDAQLAPQTIDDAGVEAKVARLQPVQFSSAQLLEAYKAERERSKAAKQEKQRQIEAQTNGANGAMDTPATGTMPDTMTKEGALGAFATSPRPGAQAGQNPRSLRRQERKDGMATVADQYPSGLAAQSIGAMIADKTVRAVESQRQLQEVLVDYWSNHFNIDVRKGICRSLKVADEREVIRPHVLGSFRELLGASAKSPAMLFYLDNASSTREQGPQQPRRGKGRLAQLNPDAATAQAAKPKKGGLNENYGRELMELHTLGVDGGYTQKDVTEVARCFTGWSINRETGEFQFKPFAHDKGEKTVLGQTIPAGGGIEDGERVLDILAVAPQTAHHISYELCQRFVADAPPDSLVDRVAGVFTRTKGDLRAVVRAIALSPEFASQGANRAKIKSPWEFAISSVRALGGEFVMPDAAQPMGQIQLIAMGGASMKQGAGGGVGGGGKGRGFRAQLPLMIAPQVATMGQPLFAQTAPTGYPEVGSMWVSSGALVSRLNFALSLSGGKVPDVSFVPLSGPVDVNALLTSLLGGQVSDGTRRTIQRAADEGADKTKVTALILGSPEFQRR